MSCNAWNHSADCTCGWGGDTGGRGFTATAVRRIAAPDGRIWSRPLTYESFTVPNARCPVCGDDVFFYQSPTGGRVFFDELGPPWPKHPCTDRQPGPSQLGPILPPLQPRSRPVPERSEKEGWHPFTGYVLRRTWIEGSDSFRVMNKAMGFGGERVPFPAGFIGEAPVFWRRSREHPGWFEFSTFRIGVAQFSEERAYTPMWPVPETSPSLSPCTFDYESLDAEALNAIGWLVSFARQGDDRGWPLSSAVNWLAAKRFFSLAAAKGSWHAKNNLAVMARDGLGAPSDVYAAFELFNAAAQSMDPVPLRHLAECHEHGIGTPKDASEARTMRDLANVIEDERDAKSAVNGAGENPRP